MIVQNTDNLQYALYIIIGALVVIVFIVIAICVFTKCGRCRQQEPPDEVIVSDSSRRNLDEQDSEDNVVTAPVKPQGSQKIKHPPVTSPIFPKSPPLSLLKPPYYEPQKEFKNSHRSIRSKENQDNSRPCRRPIPPYNEFANQKEFKKSHRSIRKKKEKSQKNQEQEDESTPQYSTASQFSQKTLKSSRRSERDSKMDKTQREDRSEKTEKSGKSTKTEKTEDTSRVSSRK